MKENITIRIVDPGYKLQSDIYIYFHIGDKIGILQGDTVVTLEHGAAIPKPTLSLDRESLQALSDALNDKGFKPKEGFLEGKLNATENHLKDMRTLLKLK